jgi:hypothetical protein
MFSVVRLGLVKPPFPWCTNHPPDIFCTSVVDHNKLNVDELTYLLSEHAGDDDVEAYVDKLISIWHKMRQIAIVANQNSYAALYASPARYLQDPPTPPAESVNGDRAVVKARV